MSKSITQDMAYRQSLMKYVEKHGVKRASRKYNKSRSYIYFWKARWDGTAESLACRSRRPHSHPNQHTEAELKLIRDMGIPVQTWNTQAELPESVQIVGFDYNERNPLNYNAAVYQI